MSFNATRLTCFALLSAIETDSREAILAIDSEQEDEIILPAQAVENATARALRERVSNPKEIDVIVQFLDFADSYQILLANKRSLNQRILRSLQGIAGQLQGLIGVRNRVAHSRPLEVGDLALLTDIARSLATSSPADWPALVETLQKLDRDPAFVLGLTIRLPSDPLTQVQHNLPIPDFDETGFFGRGAELKAVKRALLGPYPVVSILGDGGIGKTAVALKTAYDLLDTSTSPFEAVVWASAKATTLTTGEILNISGAIRDSLGLFAAAAKELGAPHNQERDPIEDVLEYLETFRILLILDNLETVTDQRLREFLLNLPTGSKVLLTSRIGLGIENPVKLEALTLEESKNFLRALAGLRNVHALKTLDDGAITKLAGKLQGHPLYIKWLVSGVQAGRRPTELIGDNSLLLDFCMSNVFDKLSVDARTILQSMQIMRGTHTLGELAYLNEFSSRRIEPAILELMTTNFVAMRHSAEFMSDSVFATGDFASQYLARHQAPSNNLRSKVTTRAQALSDIGQSLMAESRRSPYDPQTIDVRSLADVPAAGHLRDALREVKSRNFDLALESCGEAQKLSPGYPEAWRVEGLVHSYRQDLSGAIQAFERALEHAVGSSIAFHFATFLLDQVGDAQRALSVLQDAARQDPSNAFLLERIAIAHFSLGSYQDALAATVALSKATRSDAVLERGKLLALRSAVFGAERCYHDGDLAGCVAMLEDIVAFIDGTGVDAFPEFFVDWMIHLTGVAERCATEAASEPYLSKRSLDFRGRLLNWTRVIDASSLGRYTGLVRNINETKRFAFVRANYVDYFFHRNDLIDRESWQLVGQDILVAFSPETGGARGPKATQIRVLA